MTDELDPDDLAGAIASCRARSRRASSTTRSSPPRAARSHTRAVRRSWCRAAGTAGTSPRRGRHPGPRGRGDRAHRARAADPEGLPAGLGPRCIGAQGSRSPSVPGEKKCYARVDCAIREVAAGRERRQAAGGRRRRADRLDGASHRPRFKPTPRTVQGFIQCRRAARSSWHAAAAPPADAQAKSQD